MSASVRWAPLVAVAIGLVVPLGIDREDASASSVGSSASGADGPGAFANESVADVALRFEGQWGGEACREAKQSGLNGSGPYPVEPGRAANGKVLDGQEGDGQCRAFVNCVVKIASGGKVWIGGGGGNYFKRFVDVGALELTEVASLAKGDVVQSGNGVHTWIIVRAVTGKPGTFIVVDSNHDLKENVSSYERKVALGGSVRAFRLGRVPKPAGPPASGGAKLRLIRQVATGGEFTCALTKAGGVLCWGANDQGQLGDGTTAERSAPRYVSGLRSGVDEIAAGDSHACARLGNQVVKCWGSNWTGKLGDGTTQRRTTPVRVTGLPEAIRQISLGIDHSCALGTSGRVYCWGEAGNGQMAFAPNPDVPQRRPVLTSFPRASSLAATGLATCVLAFTREVWCSGQPMGGRPGATYSTVAASVIGGLSTGARMIDGVPCALLRTGGVSCWGYRETGPSPVPVSNLPSGIVQIGGLCALSGNGGAWCWNSSWQAARVPGLESDVTALGRTLGWRHQCAVISGGSLKCWGNNDHGQLGDGTRADRARAVSVIGAPVK